MLAKALLARTCDQISEASTWRNSYLTAAMELREGALANGISKASFVEALMQTPTERFLEAMAASLNGPQAEDKDLTINLVLIDTQESCVLWIENAVLHFKRAPIETKANATLTLTLTSRDQHR